MIRRDELEFDGLPVPVFSLNTAVVGSGAAGDLIPVGVRRLLEYLECDL